jgi:ComF family protein
MALRGGSLMKHSLKQLGNRALEVLYPKRCPLCDGILTFGENNSFCKACQDSVKWIEGKSCQKCGKPLELQRNDLCFDCSRKAHYFKQGHAMWLYEGQIKEAIHRYKYGNKKGYGKAFAWELFKYYQLNINWHIDMITSVPLHPDKLRERTFNQSALIADKLSEYLNIPSNNNLLMRVKNTLPQKELSDIERIHNVKDAFVFNDKYSCNGVNILIIDDVYTTGNTIDHCVKVLKNHGAHSVYFLTLAIGKGL